MPLNILIADDEEPARFALRRALAQPDYRILEAADGTSALELIRADLVFLDLQMPRLGGLEVLRQLGTDVKQSEIIVLTANDNVSTAVECIRLGAADFVTKPHEVEQIRAIARRVVQRLQLLQQVVDLQIQFEFQQGCGALSTVIRALLQIGNIESPRFWPEGPPQISPRQSVAEIAATRRPGLAVNDFPSGKHGNNADQEH